MPAQTTPPNDAALQTSQPPAAPSMTPNPPTTPTEQQKTDEENTVHMRGGELCPGRFCFIIPCPIPCDFCCI